MRGESRWLDEKRRRECGAAWRAESAFNSFIWGSGPHNHIVDPKLALNTLRKKRVRRMNHDPQGSATPHRGVLLQPAPLGGLSMLHGRDRRRQTVALRAVRRRRSRDAQAARDFATCGRAASAASSSSDVDAPRAGEHRAGAVRTSRPSWNRRTRRDPVGRAPRRGVNGVPRVAEAQAQPDRARRIHPRSKTRFN